MIRVLLVEDDPSLREGLGLALRHQGYHVHAVATGEEGLEQVRIATHAFSVVILDVMLPGITGFEVCRRLQSGNSIPVIMLTARGDDFDVVSGLEAGADDYVIKPVQPRVLDARIKAVLRRAIPATTPTSSTPTAEIHGDLTIDRAALIVTKGDSPIDLTPTELRALLELSESPERVFSRQQLLRAVWGYERLGDSRLVDACIQRLRAKIEELPSAPRYIQTVRGFGYRFGPL